MTAYGTFDDFLIEPKFSLLKSRRDVDLSSNFLGVSLKLPLVAANMDTICGANMANAMSQAGGIGALHRFMSVDENVKEFKKCDELTFVSVGITTAELERASALYQAGATHFIVDVAHGASMEVVKFVQLMKEYFKYSQVVVGNFATRESIEAFAFHAGGATPAAFKVGIGAGARCTTRVKTGCGFPMLSSVIDCVASGHPIIADGGHRTPGDIAKSLAAGAKLVMLGGMLAGTDETPGELIDTYKPGMGDGFVTKFKIYRGSASKESYDVQGKNASWRTAEGESHPVACKGPVKNILSDIEGGLRSAFTYTNSSNLDDFQRNARLIQVTANVSAENHPNYKI